MRRLGQFLYNHRGKFRSLLVGGIIASVAFSAGVATANAERFVVHPTTCVLVNYEQLPARVNGTDYGFRFERGGTPVNVARDAQDKPQLLVCYPY